MRKGTAAKPSYFGALAKVLAVVALDSLDGHGMLRSMGCQARRLAYQDNLVAQTRVVPDALKAAFGGRCNVASSIELSHR